MTWKPCEDMPNNGFSITKVDLQPDPPVIGGAATFVISATSGVEVTEGTVDISVSLIGLPIYMETQSLCDKTSCPIGPGPLDITIVELLPSIAPPADYGLRVLAKDALGSALLCVDVDFSLVPPSSSSSLCQAAMHAAMHPASWTRVPRTLWACVSQLGGSGQPRAAQQLVGKQRLA